MPQEHLTPNERYQISHMHMFGLSPAETARRFAGGACSIGTGAQQVGFTRQ